MWFNVSQWRSRVQVDFTVPKQEVWLRAQMFIPTPSLDMKLSFTEDGLNYSVCLDVQNIVVLVLLVCDVFVVDTMHY